MTDRHEGLRERLRWHIEQPAQFPDRVLPIELLRECLAALESAAPQPTADGVVRAVERAIIIRPDPPRNTTSYAWGMYDARQTALVAIRAAFAAGRKHGE